jgi:hypothetical protein
MSELETAASADDLDSLWPQLRARAEAGLLSGEALAHLLALADSLSADGDWPRAWQALGIAEIAADRAGNPGYGTEVTIHRGILD